MITVITRSRVLAWVLCVAGVALSAFVTLVTFDDGEKSEAADWLLLFVIVLGPWLVLTAFCLWWRSSRGLIAAGLLLLGCEIWVYYDVFIAPESSMVVLAYFAKPFLQVLLLLPVGLLAGWVGDRLAALKPVSGRYERRVREELR